MYRVLICGGRKYQDYDAVFRALSALGKENIEVVIDGAALGADLLGHKAARALGIPTLRFPAHWERDGRSAGVIRNQRMLDEGKPNIVLAFPAKESVGTWDMVRRARKLGLQVEVL